ncbi:MAG: hypothetical protein M1834_008155 [Cirrosporium novae-zelandiae]|nr:MAG: hypothetical protein M1834_008155 [Cirrosporium novae-zelandiae]
MANFPKLQPALSIKVTIDPPFGVGSASKGTPLAVVPMTGGTVKSEPGFSPVIDAEFVGTGNDYIHTDPDGRFMRLDAHGVLKNKSDGALIYLHYNGTVDNKPAVGAVLSGSLDAKTTEFGTIFNHMTFETGEGKYKELECGHFVGSGRFVYEQGKPVIVEYNMSKVVQG